MLNRTVATAAWVLLALGSMAAAPRGQGPAPVHPCLTGDRENYGREWSGWSTAMREIYVYAFIEGQSNTYLELFNDVPADRREPLARKTFLYYDVDALAVVMTDLYRDPANTYIRYSAMIYIAKSKLEGNNIESSLRYSRQNDCGLKKRGV